MSVVADGSPADISTNSGVAFGITEALRSDPRASVVSAIGTRARGWKRIALLGLSFRPAKRWWWFNFNFGLVSIAARSIVRSRATRALWRRGEIDYVLHVRNVYLPTRVPYIAFIDSTLTMAGRGWATWASGTALGKQILHRIERNYYSRAARVFTAGPQAALSVVNDYAIDSSRVFAIGGGVNFWPLPSVVNSVQNEPIVLWVGLDFERKGGDLLVKAMEHVRAVMPGARLVLVGDAAGGSSDGVVSFGEVRERAEMAQIYRSAAVFCLPARHEPYGLVVQEAMAFSLPCVVSATGALSSIVEDGVTGLVVDELTPESLSVALIHLLSDSESRKAMGFAARDKVQRELTWEAVASRMMEKLVCAESGAM